MRPCTISTTFRSPGGTAPYSCHAEIFTEIKGGRIAVSRAGDTLPFAPRKTSRPCGANGTGRADAPPLSVLRVSFCQFSISGSVRYIVCLAFWLLFFSELFLLLYILKGNKGRIMAPFCSPSVPTGSSARLRQTAAGAPVSLRRTPSGFGLTLRSDGEKQHPRLQCPFRTRRLNRDVNHISITLMAGMMFCRRQIFIPDVRILPSETVRLHPFAEGCF